jgi:hypothetical protein
MLENKEDLMSKKSHKGKVWSPEQRKIFSWFESGTGNLIVRAVYVSDGERGA